MKIAVSGGSRPPKTRHVSSTLGEWQSGYFRLLSLSILSLLPRFFPRPCQYLCLIHTAGEEELICPSLVYTTLRIGSCCCCCDGNSCGFPLRHHPARRLFYTSHGRRDNAVVAAASAFGVIHNISARTTR